MSVLKKALINTSPFLWSLGGGGVDEGVWVVWGGQEEWWDEKWWKRLFGVERSVRKSGDWK